MDASPITPDLDEALRYAGVRADESGDMHRKMAEIAAQCMKTVTPRCTYRVSEIAWENGMPSLFGGQLVLPGRTAAVMLRTCSHAALLVCTLGTTFDALARQVQARDFADALLLDGFGGAYVEAGCNAVEREIAAKLPGKYLTDRFSPGYGDFPLDEFERDVPAGKIIVDYENNPATRVEKMTPLEFTANINDECFDDRNNWVRAIELPKQE